MDRQSQTVLADVGLLLIRLMLAVVFIYHGAQKLFGAFEGPGIENFTASLEKMNMPMPAVGAWAAALAEFVGGILLVLGSGMRLVIPFTAFTMLVGAFKVHGDAFSIQNGGMEYA
jgi:putative oxidoreductase